MLLVKPEPQRVGALALTAPAPNMMFNIGALSKMSHIITIFLFFPLNIIQI
jgi:hypothetical protein